MADVKTETDDLADALWRVCYSAKRQLEGMGKGRDPSQRLQEALDRATELLGYDPTTVRPKFDDE